MARLAGILSPQALSGTWLQRQAGSMMEALQPVDPDTLQPLSCHAAFLSFSDQNNKGQGLFAFLPSPFGLLSSGGLVASTDGHLHCVLDGTLYNAATLAAALGLSEEQSDAELLLAAYRTWGLSMLEKLDGRWALVLADLAKGKCWLARDRIGAKPLYYGFWQNALFFASSPKALLQLPGWTPALNPEMAFDFLVLHKADQQEESLFQNIKQVLPRQVLEYDLAQKTLRDRLYWIPGVDRSRPAYDPVFFERYATQLKQILQEAIAKRLAKHQLKQPATLLSGGLDSTILLAGISQFQQPVTALSAVFEAKKFSEEHWAKIAAAAFQADWHRVTPTVDALQTHLEDFFYSQDTPTFSAGTFLQYQLFREAARLKLPLLFDGQGADGLLGGHQFHLVAHWADLRKSGQWAALRGELQQFGGITGALKYSFINFLRYRGVPNLPIALKQLFYSQYFSELRYLNPEFWQAYRNRLAQQSAGELGSLNGMLFQGYYGGGVAALLKCVDRAAHHVGVEVTAPFSESNELMEMVHQVPGVYKIHAGQQKWLLKEAYRTLLPPAIYERRSKMGLVSPNNQWLRALRPALLPYVEQLDPAIFNRDLLLREFNTLFDPATDLENFRTYKFAAFAIWSQVFQLR